MRDTAISVPSRPEIVTHAPLPVTHSRPAPHGRFAGLESLTAALSQGALAATSHLYMAGNGGSDDTKAALRAAFRGKTVDV